LQQNSDTLHACPLESGIVERSDGLHLIFD
jgi:hypothetical protein